MNFTKKFKLVTLALTVVVLCGTSILTYAAEPSNDYNLIEDVDTVEDDGEVIYEEVITTDDLTASISDLDQTFTMTSYHRGGDRKYSGNRLQYSITVTDVNGNAVNNSIRVKLYDYNHNYALAENTIDADGVRVTHRVSITANRTYYFTYSRISGANRTLKVRVQIKSYNS